MRYSQEYKNKISKDKLFLLAKMLRKYHKMVEEREQKHNIKQRLEIVNKIINDIDKVIDDYKNKIRRSDKKWITQIIQ